MRTGGHCSIYDGASVVSPRVGAFDGQDRVQAGTVYCMSGEALLHFHSDAQQFVENEDTGAMEPVVTGFEGDYMGFSLEFEVVDATGMVDVVADRGGFTIDMTVENANLSAVPPETVIAFPNASVLNMSVRRSPSSKCGLTSDTMALITLDCGTVRSLSIIWP